MVDAGGRAEHDHGKSEQDRPALRAAPRPFVEVERRSGLPARDVALVGHGSASRLQGKRPGAGPGSVAAKARISPVRHLKLRRGISYTDAFRLTPLLRGKPCRA